MTTLLDRPDNSNSSPSAFQLLLIRILAYHEIVGGLIGLYLTLAIASFVHLPYGNYWFEMLLFITSSLGGYLLLRRTKLGYRLSLLQQGIQTVGLFIHSIGYLYISGISPVILLGSQNGEKGMNLDFYYSVATIYSRLGGNNGQIFFINLVPLTFAIFLLVVRSAYMRTSKKFLD